MKNLFVPYELAVIAKEKGFNEPCLARFIDDGNKSLEIWDWDIPLRNSTNEEEDTLCTAPLYQQIVDWLREKHSIWITIYNQYKDENAGKCYGYKVQMKDTCKSNVAQSDNYYKALNKAIEEAFKLI